MMEEFFEVWLLRDEKITLKVALQIAKDNNISDLVYDPLGIYDATSYWWLIAVLEVLQQEDFIREFEVLKDPPVGQEMTSEAGIIY